MHIIKVYHETIPKPLQSARLMRDRVASVAKPEQPTLYGHRSANLQSGGFRGNVLPLILLLALASVFLPLRVHAAAPLKIIALGDSLTAGYQLPADAAFPAVLEKALRADGYDVTVVNAGVSGDTAEDGLARFDWTFADGADAAIVELGANDMLRGFDTKLTHQTLDEIFARLKQRQIPVFIAGITASPNLGSDYRTAFDQIYKDLAHKYNAPLYPFFLEGVMNKPTLQLADHMHPNREGVEKIVQNILPAVEQFVKTLPHRN